jgi:hypothetical protein
MDALSSFLGRELMKAITDKREAHMRVLLAGQAVDYPDYRARSSYLRALADVEQMIKDVDLEGDRRPHGFASGDEARSRRAPG